MFPVYRETRLTNPLFFKDGGSFPPVHTAATLERFGLPLGLRTQLQEVRHTCVLSPLTGPMMSVMSQLIFPPQFQLEKPVPLKAAAASGPL